eukprot:12924044-Alexandrium_andersonii.AAC.1
MRDHLVENANANVQVVFGRPVILPPFGIRCDALEFALGRRSTLGDGRKHAARSARTEDAQGGPKPNPGSQVHIRVAGHLSECVEELRNPVSYTHLTLPTICSV